jgi:outer membrane protein TolC
MGEQRHEIAAISQSDLLTLKLDVVNARNTLKNSEIALKRANSAFVSFLNFDKNKKVKLLLPSRPKNMQITVEEALSYARENNPDFLGYQQQLIEGEKEVDKTAKSALFDNASFSASIGFNQVAPDFRSVYLRPLQQDIFSLSFSIPLIDWGVRKGKANMAKNNLNVTKIGVEQSRNTLEEDVVMSVNDFNMQQDMIASAEEAMSLATTAYNATRERFIIGKSDISALTLALSRQKEAQKNYITALKNYWVSYYKIRKLTLYDFESGGNIEVELKDMN